MTYNPQRNYCTGIPDSWPVVGKVNFCCYSHDAAYVQQTESKLAVDIKFAQCVASNAGELWGTAALLLAVIGGAWFWYRRKWKNA